MPSQAFNPDQYLNEKSAGPQQGFDPDVYLKQKSPESSEQSQQEQGFGHQIMSGIGTVAKAVDSVTGAPARAAISAVQNGQNPIRAGWNQFGNMQDQAPSGEEIAAKAGISNNSSGSVYSGQLGKIADQYGLNSNMPSPAKVAGAGIDLAANPLNLAGPILRVVGKVGEAAEPLATSLNEFSTERALKAAGAMKKDFNLINAKGNAEDLGAFLLDKKIVTPLSTVSKVADRISEAKEAAGQTIGDILEGSQAAGAKAISAKDIALNLSEDPEIKQLASTPGSENTAKQINGFIQTLYDHPGGDNLALRDAQQLRQGIDKSINYNKFDPQMKGAQPYLFKMRDAISKAMNDSVNGLEGEGDIDRLKTANAAYSKLATLDKIAQNRLGALSSNEQLSLGDKVAAGVGAVAGHGNPIAALGLGAINKTARAVGNSLAATGANNLSKIISGAPESLSGVSNSAGPISNVINQSFMPAVESMPKAADSNPQSMPVTTPQQNSGAPMMPVQPPMQGQPQPAQPAQSPIPAQQQQQAPPIDPKGPNKWAHDGFQNLLLHADDDTKSWLDKNKSVLILDPKAKNLLITASSFQPGSKPLDDIVKHLKNRIGGK